MREPFHHIGGGNGHFWQAMVQYRFREEGALDSQAASTYLYQKPDFWEPGKCVIPRYLLPYFVFYRDKMLRRTHYLF